MKGTIDKTEERARLDIVKLQLGNTFDTNGARLVEALLVAKVKYPTRGCGHDIYIYNRHGQVWLAQACGKTAPDFEEGTAYSTSALPLERNEDQMSFPEAEKHYGISVFWLKNHWWVEKAELLDPEPLDTKKR